MKNEKVIEVLKNNISDDELKFLNDYASYRRVFDKFIDNAILCNNIIEVDSDIFCNQETGFATFDELLEDLKKEYKEELKSGEITLEELEERAENDVYNYEFYQYYIISISNWGLEYLKECCQHTLKIMYSEVLNCYILGIDHFGTSWDYVPSDFKLKIIE